jgi:polyhydroxyalkanoate synthesis regulator phasin
MEQSKSVIRENIAALKAKKDDNAKKVADEMNSLVGRLSEMKTAFTFAQAELEDLRRQVRRGN